MKKYRSIITLEVIHDEPLALVEKELAQAENIINSLSTTKPEFAAIKSIKSKTRIASKKEIKDYYPEEEES